MASGSPVLGCLPLLLSDRSSCVSGLRGRGGMPNSSFLSDLCGRGGIPNPSLNPPGLSCNTAALAMGCAGRLPAS